MPKFIFTYHAPDGYEPGGSEAITAWHAWFAGMGDALVDMGQPVFERTTIGQVPDGRLSGYSIVAAEDFEAATLLAKGCPFLGHGGGVQVGRLEELPS